MRLFSVVCVVLTLACCGISGGVIRDLQHEIDSINIQLNDPELDLEDRAYLIGRSSGIFLAIEIIADQGVW